MALTVQQFILGPLKNNCYLLVDTESRDAVVVDPSFESEKILAEIQSQKLNLKQIWLTHAHFDHIAGVGLISSGIRPQPLVGLHPADLPLWQRKGGAEYFGVAIDSGPEPSLMFSNGQILHFGNHAIEVRHTPGHTPGHVVFFISEINTCLTGDLIFHRGVGRTDLPGGDEEQLIQSIYSQIFTMPAETRLLSGHGPETTVIDEADNSPYFA